MVVFRKNTDDTDVFYVPSVYVGFFQKKRAAGRSMFDCRDAMSSSHNPDEYTGFLIFPIENNGLVEIFETENKDDVDTSHRHVTVPSDLP